MSHGVTFCAARPRRTAGRQIGHCFDDGKRWIQNFVPFPPASPRADTQEPYSFTAPVSADT
jgi:hypothetical protein